VSDREAPPPRSLNLLVTAHSSLVITPAICSMTYVTKYRRGQKTEGGDG
jgi:hypothetical protein